jgi:HEAT repeat protein
MSDAAGAADVAQLRDRFLTGERKAGTAAYRELLRLGKPAVPVLVQALTHADARTRRLAAEGLGELRELREPASADALFAATRDSNGEVRARAATALHKLGDPRALTALVATLNDYPDELHNPYTASMYPLMNGGPAVLPLVAPLLLAADLDSRERAFLIVRAVVSRHYKQEAWTTLWETLGRYDPAAPQAARDDAARQWQDWVSRRP